MNDGVINFDVVNRGALGWRVSINGEDDLPSFPTREACAAAARVRARRHHQDYGVSTRVRVPRLDGTLETTVWYSAPEEFLDAFNGSESSQEMRWACDQYGHVPR
ncbi:hypothetical protein [Lysobacter enzymogenes]|uniref:hypothetical protein n=1 Tax=Lysobacter enzymogenes TaxID=69 RepID=UPI001AFCBA63|nr:hypothetical protein [Lysobacter enzymogenes]QQQ00957.1 hypothetical protein JHW41_23300 [Lysobacter enzymogenes]